MNVKNHGIAKPEIPHEICIHLDGNILKLNDRNGILLVVEFIFSRSTRTSKNKYRIINK